MVNTSFQVFVIGANRPVGQFLTQNLSEQNYVYRGLSLDSHERINLLSSGRPFLVLVPSIFHPDDFAQVPFWLEQAAEHDIPVIMLSSLMVLDEGSEPAVSESMTALRQSPLAQDLYAIESMVRKNQRHLILRVGQGFSLMMHDFSHVVLTQLRETGSCTLDMQRRFSPTPVDDIADVLLAVLKQISCCDDLWGTYHFSGVEPVSAYAFAEALLAEAGQYEDFSNAELFSQAQGLIPEQWVPIGDNTKLFHTFGIKPKSWRKGLSRLVRRHYRV